MRNNVGTVDRLLRLLAGLLLLRLYGALDAPWKYATLLGLVLVGTALRGRCPLYQLFGVSSCGRKGGWVGHDRGFGRLTSAMRRSGVRHAPVKTGAE